MKWKTQTRLMIGGKWSRWKATGPDGFTGATRYKTKRAGFIALSGVLWLPGQEFRIVKAK